MPRSSFVISVILSALALTGHQVTTAYAAEHSDKDLRSEGIHISKDWFRIEDAVAANKKEGSWTAEQDRRLRAGLKNANKLLMLRDFPSAKGKGFELLHDIMDAMKVTHESYVPPYVGKLPVYISSGLTGFRKAFYMKFTTNLEKCISDVITETSWLSGMAYSFCRCQLNVYTQNLTQQEMGTMKHMTFRNERNRKRDDDANSFKAIMRVLPIRKKACGM